MKYKLTVLFYLILMSLNLFGQELTVGDKAPEITQKLITGEEFRLSDLRGKMVLIDFWASWCKPCRKENPQIVSIYKKYKDASFKTGDGFTVLSVSLDFKQDMCEKAIEADQLEWHYHLGEINGWKNAVAQTYNVKSIPAGFLIDGNGIIIGINVRGPELESLLKKQLKKRSVFSSKD
ncbi:MAG: hypothetical protein A2X13_08000 [Bacteroidetes bacterium GWC2_33_15]|nr:MAG: hypothetical protein A2X10_05055 [Bacteroidetes bacterium GWA2_33_15]OFX52686.1 MAG: hypothetical protein A2X13_08000 [Bacteroidetes bacterium GWC2_33_15]OFX64008.1 MAG: hypothetical protein A2X15_02335 [Bacteroidetes bacterium GWB2_32_14]OFX67307.1 MAG: hypothetical protein A2X14_12080 [Bacteroidetes bacterium GWD2_33_33]HAN18827.1 TlpA family protein disulfide reductase [Bacteroidales bacterium]